LLTPQYNENDPVLGYFEVRGATGVDRTFWKLYNALLYNAQFNRPFAYVGTLDDTLQSLFISYVSLMTNLDFRDDKIHPHKGLFIGNDLHLAGGVFGGDAQDIRVQPEVRGYIPLGKKVTIAMRGSVGVLFPQNYGDNLAAPGQPAPSDKAAWARDTQIGFFRGFFAGGPSSNRGWPLRGIGPHGIAPFFNPGIAAQQIAQLCDPASPEFSVSRCQVPLGGLSLWEASTELRFPISGPLTGATFCDAADVSPRQWNFRFKRLHLSCGLGARYDTPVGPIRLDIAYRIPGLQSLETTTLGDDGIPPEIFGLPIALAFGIGEAF
jgi:outer membrane protein insertion porin family/translocation and assembly module TamA